MAPRAAVAIIRVRAPRDAILLVRRRHNTDDPWSGHFALPGGRWQDGDTDLQQTCVRETREETGIDLGVVPVAGVLRPLTAGGAVHMPVRVQPYLFYLPTRPPVVIEEAEIEGYLWLDVEHFVNEANHEVVEVMPDLKRPVVPLQDYYLWGFTYKVLASLLEVPVHHIMIEHDE
jgi:8-oxo-dGTP diphosphatase